MNKYNKQPIRHSRSQSISIISFINQFKILCNTFLFKISYLPAGSVHESGGALRSQQHP